MAPAPARVSAAPCLTRPWKVALLSTPRDFLDRTPTQWEDEIFKASAEAIAFSLTLIRARGRPHLPKWRNWQTRYIQGVVRARAWRFEASLWNNVFWLRLGLGSTVFTVADRFDVG